jgi:hypothetical protein
MVVLAIALTAPLIAVKAHKHYAGAPIWKLAQYCMPRDDELPQANKIYCRSPDDVKRIIAGASGDAETTTEAPDVHA